ncbi:MAG TPA: magnesium and cobalt transport protein CorA [Phytomonospora sp.]
MAAEPIARCAVIHADTVEDLGDDLDGAIARTRELGAPAYLWVDAHEPPERLLREGAAALGLHPLAVEDAVGAHQRAKVDDYGEQVLVVVKTVEYYTSTAQIELGEIDLFIGPDFVLSVRHGATGVFETAYRRAMSAPKLRSHGPGGIAYVIVDAVVDEYEVIAGDVGRDIGALERRVFSPGREDVTDAIYFLKREVIEFRDAVEPVAGVLGSLISEREQLPDSVRPWLRDVEDHAMRVNTRVASFNDLLTSVLTAHQAKVGTQQNDDMRKISAWAAVIAVPTAVAGIYGMNFRDMPELSWRFGYPGVLLLMAGICGLIWWRFRRNGWL